MKLRLLVSGMLFLVATAFAGDSPPQSESVTGKVSKVYSAYEGKAKFRAYVVKWKEQAVVVSDKLVQTDYKVADAIPFLAFNLRSPRTNSTDRILHFQIWQPVPETNRVASPELIRGALNQLYGKSTPAEAEKFRQMAAERVEQVSTYVLKVYSAQDGDARFKAYGVNWRNHDVIVSDPLAKTDYKPDDIIPFLAMRIPAFRKDTNFDLLNFMVQPPFEYHPQPPLSLPFTAKQFADAGPLTGAIVDQLNRLWSKQDLAKLADRLEAQCTATPDFVPALLAKAVYTSLIAGNQPVTHDLLNRVDDLTKDHPLKSYATFRSSLQTVEKSLSAVQDQDGREDALRLMSRDRFPLGDAIKKVGNEIQPAAPNPKP